MNNVYEDAARAAYRNSLGLLEESNVLYKNSRYARSYALCVLCAEEFAKSFLYKCTSAELITDPEFQKDILKHVCRRSCR